jgi:mannose-6-phosphate isomerase-like protein (cupin superfamily)
MNIDKIPSKYLILFAAFSVVASQIACGGSRGNATGPLPPPPPPDQMKLADVQPQKAFVQVAPGLATRSIYVVEPSAKDPYHVEVLDILVAPGKEAVAVPLQGAATLEVRTGNGTATIGQKSQELGAGSTFSVGEGEPLRIAAKGDGPITLRAYVVKVP